MNNKKYINAGLDWALTSKAKESLEKLIRSGFDYDLAYAILEEELPEKEMYELPTED